MEPIIRMEGVSKRFGRTVALADVSARVTPGDVYGFLGLNGAGKTTLIRVLLGMVTPDAGAVWLFGRRLAPDFAQWNDVGYLVETPHAYPDLSVLDNLRVMASLRGLPGRAAIDHVIDALQLGTYRAVPARHLSLGNQQRLGLAKALLHRPRLLILDEPINGLDPRGIVEVRALILALARGGTTVFVSSHILDEIARIANRIAVLHAGRLVRELTVEVLERELVSTLVVDTADNARAAAVLRAAGYAPALDAAEALAPHAALSPASPLLALRDAHAIARPEAVAQALAAADLWPRRLSTHREDLEHYFLRLIRTEPT